MKIGGLGGLEIVIILVVILIIFGPKNLPKLGTAIGKTVKNLREGLGGGKKKDAEEAPEEAKEPEELEVVNKPEPGQKAAEATSEKQPEKETEKAE
jgi:sec-independent protein translocase protein TatA